MPIELQEERYISAGATRMVAVSFDRWLDGLPGTPVLVGTPTVVEVTTTALTLANKAVNIATLTINDKQVTAGRAVQFSVTTPANGAGTNYRVRITATSDGSPAESEPMDVILRCV